MSFDAAWDVYRYATLPSTMDQAALLAQQGARDRTAVVSDEQTAGRGRGGRVWHSLPGDALYCTLIVRPDVAPDRLPALSLLTGVAVAEAIEAACGRPARLKWPNDVWLGDDPAHQKVAGILLTSKLTGSTVEYALVGIGINVGTPPEHVPPGATSILATSGVSVQSHRLLAALLARFDVAYAHLLATRGRPSLDAWRDRAALLNEDVYLEYESGVRQGIFSGIDDDGALLWREADGQLHRIMAGDLVRGPRRDQRP